MRKIFALAKENCSRWLGNEVYSQIVLVALRAGFSPLFSCLLASRSVLAPPVEYHQTTSSFFTSAGNRLNTRLADSLRAPVASSMISDRLISTMTDATRRSLP